MIRINKPQLPWLQTAIYHTVLDVKMEVTQCTGRVSANTRYHHLYKCIIRRAGASPPSRATGVIFIFLTHSVYTYRIILNVSTHFYFSVYATISLEHRASCCLCCSQLSSTMPSNAIHPSPSPSTLDNTRFTTDHSLCLNGINSCCVLPPPTTTLCVFYGEPCLYNLIRCLSV